MSIRDFKCLWSIFTKFWFSRFFRKLFDFAINKISFTKPSLGKKPATFCKNFFSKTYFANVGVLKCVETPEPHGTPYEIMGVKVVRVWCQNGEKNRENFEVFEYLKGSPTIPKSDQNSLKVPKTVVFWLKSALFCENFRP